MYISVFHNVAPLRNYGASNATASKIDAKFWTFQPL